MSPLVLACGALATELRTVLEVSGLADRIEVRYLPANLHNHPERIVPDLTVLLARLDPDGVRPVLIAYADCGTGGALDALLAEQPRLRRLPGAHCYEFFAGAEVFGALHAEEPGTFYLTDYLAKHFDPLVWQGLGLDRHPELRDVYFAHYRRVVLLSQRPDDDHTTRSAQAAADRLGLPLLHRHIGYAPFAEAVTGALGRRA